MENYSKLLSKEDFEVINERFGTDLVYNDARHYRAGQVIWNLWKNPMNPANVIEKKEEKPKED
ncbi:hypothetical protein QWZ15_12790 [Cyclobacterium jeungdonense]|uniref:Uncharacterized protein n=2 Tax=Cyclobacterium jeungdonense TaxID=708087 RepID=A0ABT8C8L4_9BACT|nr:hypothetical protein [Cyclobacterium jeungdonense]